jgi:hypothetical protein
MCYSSALSTEASMPKDLKNGEQRWSRRCLLLLWPTLVESRAKKQNPSFRRRVRPRSDPWRQRSKPLARCLGETKCSVGIRTSWAHGRKLSPFLFKFLAGLANMIHIVWGTRPALRSCTSGYLARWMRSKTGWADYDFALRDSNRGFHSI